MKNLTSILGNLLWICNICSLCCCGNNRTTQTIDPSMAIDSVVFYYTYSSYIGFTNETAEEFATTVKNYRKQHGHIKIIDRDTIRILYQKAHSLKPEIDTLRWQVDVRMMGIYHNASKNDSVFLSQVYNDVFELNHKTMQSDTCFWLLVRDIISERDTLFKKYYGYNTAIMLDY